MTLVSFEDINKELTMSQSPQSQFVRLYKRQSKSPFDDASTILLLANVVSFDEHNLHLDFSRYIYLHRDDVGKPVGLSVSNTIAKQELNLDSKYIAMENAFPVLNEYLAEIESFCEIWSIEFQELFLLPPNHYWKVILQHCQN